MLLLGFLGNTSKDKLSPPSEACQWHDLDQIFIIVNLFYITTQPKVCSTEKYVFCLLDQLPCHESDRVEKEEGVVEEQPFDTPLTWEEYIEAQEEHHDDSEEDAKVCCIRSEAAFVRKRIPRSVLRLHSKVEVDVGETNCHVAEQLICRDKVNEVAHDFRGIAADVENGEEAGRQAGKNSINGYARTDGSRKDFGRTAGKRHRVQTALAGEHIAIASGEHRGHYNRIEEMRQARNVEPLHGDDER